MKKATILTTIILILVAGTGISFILYRNGLLTKTQREEKQEAEERVQELMIPGQEGEADDISESFARTIEEKTGIPVDPKNIVSAGSTIRSGKYDITITDWDVSKESPGYAIPEGLDLAQYPGAILDESGKITNEFSYVTTNVTVKNISEESITGYIWGFLRLKTFNAGEYLGEVNYLGNLGEETSKEHGHDTYKDSFAPGEEKSMALIYVAPDKALTDQNMYIEIDQSGVALSEEEYDIKRYIILNENGGTKI